MIPGSDLSLERSQNAMRMHRRLVTAKTSETVSKRFQNVSKDVIEAHEVAVLLPQRDQKTFKRPLKDKDSEAETFSSGHFKSIQIT